MAPYLDTCAACGHSLAGIAPTAPCPECGSHERIPSEVPTYSRKQVVAFQILGLLLAFSPFVLARYVLAPTANSACFLSVPAFIGGLVIVWGAKHIRSPDPESTIYAPVTIGVLSACWIGPMSAIGLLAVGAIAPNSVGPAFAIASLLSPLVGLAGGFVAALVTAALGRRRRGSA